MRKRTGGGTLVTGTAEAVSGSRVGGNRGFILEVVLLGCMVVFILAITMVDTGERRVRSAATAYQKAQAFHAAEAGLARVEAALARGEDPQWADEPGEIGGCTYSVELDRAAGGEVVTVISTGEFRRANGERITVAVRAVLRRSGSGEAWRTEAWERLSP